MSTQMSPTSPSHSPSHSSWLRTTSNGFRANKSSRSVLATIGEEQQQAPGLAMARAASVSGCFSGTFGRRRASSVAAAAACMTDAPDVDEFGFRTVGNNNDSEQPSSPTSSHSRSTTGSSRVQIATAIRVQTARARSHSIDEIKQLLSPSPEEPSRSHPHPRPPPLDLSSQPKPFLYQPVTSTPSPRSINPLSAGSSSSSPLQLPTPTSAGPRRPPRPSAIVKDFSALLEHIHEDETESTESAGSSSTRSATLSLVHHRSDSLPPPPRPRNKALVRPAPHPFANPSVSVSISPAQSRLSSQSLNFTPRSSGPLSRKPSAFTFTSNLPLTPAAVPLPLSSFPQSFPSTPREESTPPSPAYNRASFLPSCKSTIGAPTVKGEDSIDRAHRVSTISDYNFPVHAYQRASGLSFCSSVSGYSARSPTEAESIPIGLYNRPTQLDFDLAPLSPCSSLNVVDVQLPSRDRDREEEDETSESGSCLTTEESFSKKEKDSKGLCERARSLSAAFNVSSLNKVDRVLGKGAARALLSGFPTTTTTPTMEPSAPLLPSSPSAGESFLPTLPVTSPFGRKLSKKGAAGPGEPNMGRRRSDDVHGSGLMARMDRFIGRTPSPSARTKELEDEVDELPPPPPPPPKTHARKHSSSDPSAGIMRPRPMSSDRPATTNTRTASERAEMVKKARKIQQLLGDVPSEAAGADTFYRHSRAARSEDFEEDDGASPLPPPIRIAGRRHSNPGTFSDVLVIEGEGAGVGRVPSQNKGQTKRGYHRPTASASSALSALPLLPPMVPVSPALISPGSMAMLSPGYTASSMGESMLSPRSNKEEVESDVDEKINVVEVEQVDDEDEIGTGDEGDDDAAAAARRAKRAKVAKLHRYLGSRVPAHLVLGLDESWDHEQGLPEVRYQERQSGGGGSGGMGVLALGGLKKRRESEGAGEEEEIGDLSVMSSEEKARAVRRKAKMEKMFGERPPQKLYQPHSDRDTSIALDDLSEEEDDEAEAWEEAEGGEHYKSYRASFNSLAYFVSNADRDSLEGLYNIVSSTAPSEKGDEGSGGANQFAARRKRAAKLSKFFGVSYRDLFGAVLDILESDVREDKEEGSLSAAETQDLLMKLRRLKAKGEDIHV